MGLFDSLKKAMGGGGGQTETVKGPSMVLREAGIDPGSLDFDIRSDGSLAVSGTVASQADSDRIAEVLAGIPQVNSVENNLTVGSPEPAPEPAPAPTPDPTPAATAAPEPPVASPAAGEAAAPEGAGGRTYTVQSGDSLWKIAEAMYGDGSKYMAIFEANKDKLDDPDRIVPGQELSIPDPEG